MPSKSPQRKSLGELLRRAKAEASDRPRRVVKAAQPELVPTAVSLTPAAKETLDRLMTHVSATTGRKTSASSIMRALLHLAEKNGLARQISAAIETELNTGAVVWGKARKL
jgi:hypothetical protein